MKYQISVVPEGLSRTILGTERRVGHEGHYCLIVPDHAAGLRGRFTVYQIPSSPSRRIKIIGRELTWAHAARVAKATEQTGTEGDTK